MGLWKGSVFLFAAAAAASAHTASMTYSALPPVSTYTDGEFTSPNPSTIFFNEGQHMNISWSSTYQSVNLWLIKDNDFAEPVGIASGWGQPWYDWIITAPNGNLTVPFSFRIVNAQGTQEEQQNGGVLSTQFWITPNPNLVSTSSLSMTTIPSAIAPSTSHASITASPTITSTAAASSPSSSGLSTGAKAGIGAGVGIGAALILIATAGYFLWRRNNNKKQAVAYSEAPQGPPQPPMSEFGGSTYHNGSTYQGGYQDPPSRWASPQPQHSSPYGAPASPYAGMAPSELDTQLKSPVEAPGHTHFHNEPQELPAHEIGGENPKPPQFA